MRKQGCNTVAVLSLQEQDLSTEARPDLAEGVVAASVFIHQSVERTSTAFFAELRRAAYVTPTSYLELLNTFTALLGERREALERTRSRLAIGLEKLLSTAGVHLCFCIVCYTSCSCARCTLPDVLEQCGKVVFRHQLGAVRC